MNFVKKLIFEMNLKKLFKFKKNKCNFNLFNKKYGEFENQIKIPSFEERS